MNQSRYQDRVPSRRRAAFRVLAIALSLLPLVLIELGLRLSGKSASEAIDETPVVNLEGLQPLFELDESAGEPRRWRIPNSRMNFFCPASFLAEKPFGSKRIFVLGGSTVQGRPYATETAFSTWLQLRLEAVSPGTLLEVVNCGGVSYASYRVKKILDEVLTHEPDAIVVYTGHNEFLESRSYAAVRELSPLRRLVAKSASKLFTVRAMRRWWYSDKSQSGTAALTKMPSEVDARLDHASGLEEYDRDERWQTNVEQHFASTLREMVVACQSANVPVLICVPACEWVNTPPFKIQSAPTLTSDELIRFEEAWRIVTEPSESIELRDRIAACTECSLIDPQHAGANYLLGRWAYEGGNANRAHQYLQQAIDCDVCPLRATSTIVDSTRRLIDEFQLPHVDVNQLLDERGASVLRTPDSIPDPSRFVDHVHPTIGGHQMIAEAIAIELQRFGWPAADESAKQRYVESSQRHLASLTEVYYGRGKQRLAGLRNWAAGRAAKMGILQEPSAQGIPAAPTNSDHSSTSHEHEASNH